MTQRTPMYQEHLASKGRMVEFCGWEMPIQYSGLIAEHECVRTKVGLFDVSHMGEFTIQGPKALEYLNRVTVNDVTKLVDGQCQYTLLCYDNGTVVDDLIISRLGPNKFLAVVNAANIDKDFAWMTKQNTEGVDLKNISAQKALLAIQGPLAGKVIQDLLGVSFSDLAYYHCREMTHHGVPVFVSRTGYTGEYGFEVMVPWELGGEYWKETLKVGQKHGILPIGLGARDTLRLEATYPLYGHEISDKIIPLEANLGWVIKIDKGPFVGRDALIKAKEVGLPRKLVGIELTEPGIARDGYPVYHQDKLVGTVTSGTHGPSLKKSIALVLIQRDIATVGSTLSVDIRGKKKQAVIIKTPFYKGTAQM